jgi:hypothetical protein
MFAIDVDADMFTWTPSYKLSFSYKLIMSKLASLSQTPFFFFDIYNDV